ncbi:MAG: twin-arginine translocation signal domain-containing protein [Nanoarchaeota archaeon]
MDLTRRQFLKTASLAVASTFVPGVLTANQSRNHDEDLKGIEDLVTEDKPEYKNKYVNISVTEYFGRLTDSDILELMLRNKDRVYGDLPDEEYEEIFDKSMEMKNPHFFVNMPAESPRFLVYDLLEPTKSEIKDYKNFLGKFSGFVGVGLIWKIYEEFQGRMILYQPFKKPGSEIKHPATVLSKRLGEIFCVEKALAVYDICSAYGLKIKFPVGDDVDPKKLGHMWTRLFFGNSYVDLDPSLYPAFTVLRRNNPEIIPS